MNTVKVRNIVIGEGMPKICVPITGETKEAVLEEARAIRKLPVDVVEWRVDRFENVFDFAALEDVLKTLHEILEDTPILLTFRTSGEGGEKAAGDEFYVDINLNAVRTGFVDMIDVELFKGDEIVRKLIRGAHAAGVRVVVSNHDFSKTPGKEEIIRRLCRMQALGADIPKIAVMPQKKMDVLTLLAATEEMAREHADRPFVAVSMAAEGTISRIAGEVFGSAMTFGAAAKASAPGQMDAEDLKQILMLLHETLRQTR